MPALSRPITAELFVSLDLVAEEPQTWHFPWVQKGMLAEVSRELGTDTLLLGRRTYEVFAGSWPDRGDDVPLAAQLNGMRKVVVSDRLADEDLGWSNSRALAVQGDLPAAIARLEGLAAGDGTRVTVAGSISLVEHLLAAGLLSELRLLVHPVVRGTGRRLFDAWPSAPVEFDLLESTPLEKGARLDVYRPVPRERHAAAST